MEKIIMKEMSWPEVEQVLKSPNINMEKAVEDRPGYSLTDRYAGAKGQGPVTFHSRKIFPKMGKSPGVMGDPTVASKDTGEMIISSVVNDLTDIMQQIVQSKTITKE